MANEISTAGVLVKYAPEVSAGVRPSTNYTTIPNIKSTPDFNPEPSTLEVTDLSDTTWKRYIAGLKDPGGPMAFTANFTSAFRTAWGSVVSAYTSAIANNKATWFEIMVPDVASFYFAGEPAALGLGAMEVDSVAEVDVYVTPNQIEGWASSST